jgi:large conductance mechanosensitive channel
MIKEFKEFISKGNVVDLAVAVIIGAAFAVIVKSFTDGILMPLIGAVGGKRSFDEYVLTINGSNILWGSFITAVVNFLIVAVALFVIVKAVNKMQDFRKTAEEEAEDEATELELLTEIRDLLVAQSKAS